MAIAEAPNRRTIERFKLRPMYSRVVVVDSAAGQTLEGHAYDISLGGVRYEIDHALAEGTRVELEIQFPGAVFPIRGSGLVVRVFDGDDDPGPRRHAVRLDRFLSDHDRQRLARLIDDGWCGRPR